MDSFIVILLSWFWGHCEKQDGRQRHYFESIYFFAYLNEDYNNTRHIVIKFYTYIYYANSL